MLTSYVPSCWFSSLWQFVNDQNIDLIGSFGSIPLLQEGDICLMTQFVAVKYKGKNLKAFNYVREKLRALTLADIVTIDGKQITE